MVKSDTACERTESQVAADGLRDRLDSLYHGFNAAASLTDPIELVRPYESGPDREIAGFIAAGLAFGNVVAVMASVRAVLARMGPSPAAFVRQFDPRRDAALFDGFVHRWTRDRDIVALLYVLRQMLDRCGSIEGFFAEGDDHRSPDVGRRPRVVLEARAGARREACLRVEAGRVRASPISSLARRVAARASG